MTLMDLNRQDEKGMDVEEKLKQELGLHFPHIFGARRSEETPEPHSVSESKHRKNILTEEQQLLYEGVLWDKIRDKWFDLVYIVRSTGYSLGKFPTLYSLKKKGDQEGFDKVLEDIYNYAEKLYKKHPNHEFKSQLQKLMKELEQLDDLTYAEFEKDPSKFSPHQQDILMNGMKVTDRGIERDRDRYNVR